ncbi:MAG: tyrosine-type recombinase/integrase [Holosporales bacterium]
MPVQKITRKFVDVPVGVADKIFKRATRVGEPPTSTQKEFYWDTELKGFGVVVTERGKKTFIINYTTKDNRYRRKTIGDCNKLSVEQARTIAKDLFYDIAKGIDPIAEEASYREEQTFQQALEDYYSQYMKTHAAASTLRTERYRIDRVLIPTFGARKISSITHKDICDFMNKQRDKPIDANRSRALLSAFFGSCEKWGLIPRGSNPVTGAPKFPENKRERFLSLEQFARLESVLAGAEKTLSESPYVIAMIRLLMHTGCRPGEIQNLQWAWVDLDKRNIRMPRTSTKEKRAKTIFITEPMLEIFASLKRVEGNTYVICSERMDGKPVNNVAKARTPNCAAAKLEYLHLHDVRHSHARRRCRHYFSARNARVGKQPWLFTADDWGIVRAQPVSDNAALCASGRHAATAGGRAHQQGNC